MYTCTFFGHHDAPNSIKPAIKKTITHLIENKNVFHFYVGTHGHFDNMVRDVLKELQQKYPHIKYNIVLAYLSQPIDDTENTIYPDIEKVPLRFAISGRNKWMINKSQYVICYIENNLSNSHKFLEIATKKNKIIINLYTT